MIVIEGINMNTNVAVKNNGHEAGIDTVSKSNDKIEEHKILFIEDDRSWHDVVNRALTRYRPKRHRASLQSVYSQKDAFEALQKDSDIALIIIDLNLVKGEQDNYGPANLKTPHGMLLAEIILQNFPGIPIVFFTSQANSRRVVNAITKLNVRDVILKAEVQEGLRFLSDRLWKAILNE